MLDLYLFTKRLQKMPRMELKKKEIRLHKSSQRLLFYLMVHMELKLLSLITLHRKLNLMVNKLKSLIYPYDTP
jgi:hypothetical protein